MRVVDQVVEGLRRLRGRVPLYCEECQTVSAERTCPVCRWTASPAQGRGEGEDG